MSGAAEICESECVMSAGTGEDRRLKRSPVWLAMQGALRTAGTHACLYGGAECVNENVHGAGTGQKKDKKNKMDTSPGSVSSRHETRKKKRKSREVMSPAGAGSECMVPG